MANASTTDKGKLLESLVAMLHEGPGVTIQQRVKLPTRYNPKRKREVDILVTGAVAGYRVQLAIECKNLRRPVTTEQIGDFAAKLNQLGLAHSQGLFVTTSSFTEDALEHAESLGMRTLVFPDLTEDRLNLVVSEALQAIVFLLPEVVAMYVVDGAEVPGPEIGEAFMLYDQNDAPAGTIPDFAWDAWRKRRIPQEIGRHALALELPEGWYQLIGGQMQPVRYISVVVQVTGLALTLRGDSRRQSLGNAVDGTLDCLSTQAKWQPPKGRYQLRTFSTPEELEQYVRSEPHLHVVSQVPLPRIRFWNMMFWPPSERVAETIASRMEAFEKGLAPDPRPFDFTELEGSDLSTVWEPVAREYAAEERPGAA